MIQWVKVRTAIEHHLHFEGVVNGTNADVCSNFEQ